MRLRALALPAALAVLPLAAHAQDTAPERVTEGFGAWEMRCQRLPAAADTPDIPGPMACEVTQETLLQSSAAPVTRIAVGRPAPDAALTAVVQLPLGLWLPAGAAIELGGGQSALPLDLLRCLPQGCIAEIAVTDDLRAALSDETITDSALRFEMQEGMPARVPLVHTGFAAALAALETRAAAAQ